VEVDGPTSASETILSVLTMPRRLSSAVSSALFILHGDFRVAAAGMKSSERIGNRCGRRGMDLESREAAAADPQSKLLFPCKFVIIKMAMVNMRYNTIA